MRNSCMTCAVIGLALLAVHWLGASSAMATVPTLTHEWNFDGNLNDSVGTKTANNLGTGCTASGTGGIAGGAVTFDGINDLLYIAATSVGSGTEADPYGIMDSPIPAGAFTISFWEYCYSSSNQGYFISDAAVHPEYQYHDTPDPYSWKDGWGNLMIRRRINHDSATGEDSIKGFAEIGPGRPGTGGLDYPAYQPWLVDDGYWDERFGYAGYPNFDYGDPRLNPELPAGQWIHHVITNYQQAPGFDTDGGGRQVWYVNGQVALWGGPSPDPFPGLLPLENTEPAPVPEHEFNWNRDKVGLVIGNLIDNAYVDEFNSGVHPEYGYPYVSDARVGPTGNYHGKIDEFQIYSGSVTPDMVRYLHENPDRTLITYVAPAESAHPADGHVYHWRFDGNLDEEHGSGYNGTAIGNAAAGTTNGVVGGAVYFDGADDAVSIAQNVLPSGDYSVVFWSKMSYAPTDHRGGAFLADGGSYDNFRLTTEWEAPWRGPVRNTRVFEGESSACWTLRFGADGSAEMQSWLSNQWNQHAFIVNPEGDVSYYVNNQLMSETASFPFAGLLGDLYLGNNAAMNYDFFGYLDDLQIYNWDINAEEVAWLFSHPGEELEIKDWLVYQPYDLNQDGFVGADDLDIVRAHWGEPGIIGDISADGFVGADDLDIIRAHWGEVCPPVPGLVPEPSMIVLLAMGGLMLVAVRRAG